MSSRTWSSTWTGGAAISFFCALHALSSSYHVTGKGPITVYDLPFSVWFLCNKGAEDSVLVDKAIPAMLVPFLVHRQCYIDNATPKNAHACLQHTRGQPLALRPEKSSVHRSSCILKSRSRENCHFPEQSPRNVN